MDDLIKALEKMKQELHLLHNEIKELQAEKKRTLPDGWRIIPGTKND